MVILIDHKLAIRNRFSHEDRKIEWGLNLNFKLCGGDQQLVEHYDLVLFSLFISLIRAILNGEWFKT